MLAASNADMKSYWSDEIFAKVFSYSMGYTLLMNFKFQINYYLMLINKFNIVMNLYLFPLLIWHNLSS